jgi:hypothetical protein
MLRPVMPAKHLRVNTSRLAHSQNTFELIDFRRASKRIRLDVRIVADLVLVDVVVKKKPD